MGYRPHPQNPRPSTTLHRVEPLILRSLKSPESYFQAAFRVQSPWTTRNDDGTRTINKRTCFVFDFDPNRALSLVYQYGTKLAGGSTRTAPADVIGELIEYLPIFAFDGGRMDEVDVNTVMDWGTAGAGAAMLAKRWGSPRLIDLSEAVLTKLLADSDLLDRLEQIEDFRNLRQDANKIIAQSKKVRDGKAKRSGSDDDEPEDPEVAAARKAKREQVKTLRDKLLKFVQAVPVFMYLMVRRGFGVAGECGSASLDLGDDLLGGLGPDEGPGVVVPV